ncbi:unnamed protein product [Oikopleura dioica]|uniref:Peptidase S1 domain-containing protein n=1 Tax=Oikopleura dioica TaxID=34765 RepID=E4X5N8_OIKDI|nr:unnamed protein product [Oikopleura dioica]
MKILGAFLSFAQAGTWEIPETWKYCEAREQVDPRLRWMKSARIIGGGVVKRDAWPFIVRLRIGRNDTCGRSLIDGKHVLTAAHCCDGAQPKNIIAHVKDYSRKVIDEGEKTVKVTKIVEHEEFLYRHYKNDVCLLTLEEDVSEIIEHKYACLPPADWDWRIMSTCYTAGWGTDHESFGKEVDILNSVNVNIFDDNYCVLEQDHDAETMICAGAIGGGRDACQGDSGGPLICEINGNAVLAGVTSWGIGCGRAGSPGEWAKVSNYLDWINNNLPALQTTPKPTPVTRTSSPSTPSTPSPTPLIHTTKSTTKSITGHVIHSQVFMLPWKKILARRYCASEDSESGLINWTEIATFVGGGKKVLIEKKFYNIFSKTDERLMGLNKCQNELNDKIIAKPSTLDKERTSELMDLAIKRQVCVRAKKRGHFNGLPCKEACEEVLKAYKRKSDSIKITNKEKKKVQFWTKICLTKQSSIFKNT